MNKKTKKITEKILIGLAIASVVITFIEGMFYYTTEAYPNAVIRIMLTIQNMIRAFGFKSDIGIKDVAEILQSDRTVLELVINYVYLAAIFIAPYCTVAFLYKILKKLFRFRRKRQSDKNEGIIIVGYNDEVKMLLEDYRKKKEQFRHYRIHLVAENISEEEEMQWIKNGVLVHNIDCLKLSGEELKYFFGQMKSHMAKKIIFFEKASERNFSLYKMFHEEKEAGSFRADVKFFCRCENDGIRALIEDFHDSQSDFDMELISIPQLRVQKTLQQNTLYDYYTAEPKTEADILKWDVHLLIVGFGSLGQQMLLQTMQQGVLSSSNKIIVDIVDFDIEEKASIFLNTFHEDYVLIEKDRISIPADKADGVFEARFHQMDIRYKEFFELLKQNGDAQHGGAYTYAAICIEDTKVGIHCLTEIQRYLHSYSSDWEKVHILIRMEMDKYLKGYLNDNDKTFKNVFAIAETPDVVTLEDLLHDKLDEDAKEFNRIYNSIQIVSEKEHAQAKGTEAATTGKNASEERKAMWRKLKLFRRDSSRALAMHSDIKEIVWKTMLQTEDSDEQLERMFGESGVLLKAQGNVWVYDDEDAFVDKQSDRKLYPYASEISRLEHRRWCYFMASRGWCPAKAGDEERVRAAAKIKAGAEDEEKVKKEARVLLDLEKKNACLCIWEDLLLIRKDTCKYDLMWLLKKYREKQ